MSSFRLQTGRMAIALLFTRKAVLICSVLLLDGRRAHQIENMLGTICNACFALLYFGTRNYLMDGQVLYVLASPNRGMLLTANLIQLSV